VGEKRVRSRTGNSKVREGGGERGAPGAEAPICCSPRTAHAGADIHCSPCRAHAGADFFLKDCSPVGRAQTGAMEKSKREGQKLCTDHMHPIPPCIAQSWVGESGVTLNVGNGGGNVLFH